MIKGINATEETIIKDILQPYKSDYEFYFYGSRVKGGFEKTSDLDVLVKGEYEMPIGILQDIKEQFDKSYLPYIVNFTDYHSAAKWFLDSIEKSLVLCEL